VPREERVKQASPTAGPVAVDRKEAKRASRGSRQAMAQGRLGQEPVDIDSLEGSFIGKVVHVPGGMQVIMAAVLVLVLTAMGIFMNTVPPEGAEVGAEATRTLVDAYGASAVLFLAPPVILVGNALFFSLHERRRRMWTISAVMLVIFAALMLQFVFPAAFLAYAAWRSKKIEDGPARRRRTSSADGEAAGGDPGQASADAEEHEPGPVDRV
jgi:hypothetical protein